MTVYREDAGELHRPVRLDNGWMRVEARITKTGIFEYLRPDGTVQRELRLPEEVFKADAMNSFALVPVLDGHPPRGEHILNAETARKYVKGAVGQPQRDGEFVRAPMMIMDSQLAQKLDAKMVSQVSCGYSCGLEQAEPGANWNGQHYDFIQRDIRGNHVAVVPVARAGEDVRIRLDSANNVAVEFSPSDGTELPPKPEETPVSTLKINIPPGIDVEVVEGPGAQALQAHLRTMVERADAAEKGAAAAKAQVDKASGERDALKEELEKQKKAHADAADPVRIDALVKERMALYDVARKALGSEKLDGLDPAEIRLRVLKKVSPGFDPAGKSPEYLQARFDAVAEQVAAVPDPTLVGVRHAALRADADDGGLKLSTDAERRAALAKVFNPAEAAKH